ncbi:protein of unknown function [Shewanella benthica]|uniref:Uncharacterized protein n=1 Tax=Shewanella benthica TaxID=43661 RepID=A0A330M792_9GAMM|nr:protein of unknown function [Shewanella benthica]
MMFHSVLYCILFLYSDTMTKFNALYVSYDSCLIVSKSLCHLLGMV